jgi:hypothetical protein
MEERISSKFQPLLVVLVTLIYILGNIATLLMYKKCACTCGMLLQTLTVSFLLAGLVWQICRSKANYIVRLFLTGFTIFVYNIYFLGNIIRVIGMMQWMVLFCKLLLGSKIDSYFNYADRGLGPCPECLCKYLAPTKALLDLHKKKDRGLGPDA